MEEENKIEPSGKVSITYAGNDCVCSGNCTVSVCGNGFWQVLGDGQNMTLTKLNPLVPESIHVNELEKIVVVRWTDGTEIKVTCDNDDTFNVDAGFAQALKYKLFGGKTEYKEKWGKIISRRIQYHVNKPKKVEPKSRRK